MVRKKINLEQAEIKTEKAKYSELVASTNVSYLVLFASH
jgi:hypothetical protein